MAGDLPSPYLRIGDIPDPSIRRGIRASAALSGAGAIAIAAAAFLALIRWLVDRWVVSPWLALALGITGVPLAVLGLRRVFDVMGQAREFVSRESQSHNTLER